VPVEADSDVCRPHVGEAPYFIYDPRVLNQTLRGMAEERGKVMERQGG